MHPGFRLLEPIVDQVIEEYLRNVDVLLTRKKTIQQIYSIVVEQADKQLRTLLAQYYDVSMILGDTQFAASGWYWSILPEKDNFFRHLQNITFTFVLYEVVNSQPRPTIIYTIEPLSKNTISALNGISVLFDKQRCRLSNQLDIDKCIFAGDVNIHLLAKTNYRQWRSFGSDTLALANCAAGRVDVCVLQNPTSFCIEIARTYSRLCGGVIAGLRGESEPTPMTGLVLANPKILKKVIQYLRAFDIPSK